MIHPARDPYYQLLHRILLLTYNVVNVNVYIYTIAGCRRRPAGRRRRPKVEAVTGSAGRGGRVSIGRWLRVGLLTILAAVVVNLVIRTVAVASFGLPGFLPLAVESW
jgi:hypothetical protein